MTSKLKLKAGGGLGQLRCLAHGGAVVAVGVLVVVVIVYQADDSSVCACTRLF